MKMKKMIHTPEGMRDVYGVECERKLYLQKKLQKVFHVYGYQDIETPTVEYADVFSQEIAMTPSEELYRFSDREGNSLALRPDFTPSIARAASNCFLPEDFPIRLCYQGNTFVNHFTYPGGWKESTQLGVELLGEDSVDADGEIIALAVHALKETGLTDFHIRIGQTDFYRSLVEETGIESDVLAMLQELHVSGSCSILQKAKSMTQNPKAAAAIERLEELYDVLTQYGCESYVIFDLGMRSNNPYYTGIFFQGFADVTDEVLVKGGRYNHLLEIFAQKKPSIGFCLMMEPMMHALERQKIDVPIYKGRTLLVYDAKTRNLAIRMSIAHRERYMEIQCMRMEEGKTAQDYIPYGKHHQFVELVYPISADEIRVYNLFTDETVKTDWDGFR